MSSDYDKIFKENIGQFFLSLSEQYLGLSIAATEELKDKLQTTLEKEADFLRLVTTSSGERFILHLEFQSSNESRMVYRMQEYHAILQKKYRLPVRQYVIYLGNKQARMRTQLRGKEVFTGFTLLDIRQWSYQQLLASKVAEEVQLAILADFEAEEAPAALSKIISRLQQLSEDQITLKKYIRQLLTLSRLRSLTTLTNQQLQQMGLKFNIKEDVLYQEGREEGIAEGKKRGMAEGKKRGMAEGKKKGLQEGEQRKKQKMVINLLRAGKLSLEEIAEAAETTVDEVKKIEQEQAS